MKKNININNYNLHNTINNNILIKKNDVLMIEKIIKGKTFKFTGKCIKIKKNFNNSYLNKIRIKTKINNQFILFDIFVNNPNIIELKKLL